ncbi:flavodoxin domain-containing protein [Nocardia sp. CDC160]|uniref:flavodoxin domain-containing protein n=1 Tax=Nocardia sp. CDC160 TaxID=3112166 RepID=UPI002DB6807F|nr:flavodoxin domain-containing protein [Nocardia sp. CDC160]MEC3918671.1 flavodoxin domain-containing protein [Nocardia sp. CDC160]
MRGTILVAYASRYGSTREVAERIADTLRECGYEVDCRDMREVRSIDDYRTVVLGAPFYYGRWPRTARHFLSRFGPGLAHRDVAVFATGHIAADKSADTRTQLDILLERNDWLRPFSSEIFGGRWDPAVLRGPQRMMLWFPASPLRALPPADLRDWPAIEKWARSVAESVKAGAAQPNPPNAGQQHSRSGASLSSIGEYIADQQRKELRP